VWKMKKILLLKDYRNQFWLKSDYKEQTVDLKLLEKEFQSLGYDVFLKHYADINFKKDNYRGYGVFYQSSEDPDLLYKSYIEDILLGLKLQGAVLIPDFMYFRANHNKVFMEILRELYGTEPMKALKSWYFGTYEEYRNDKRIDFDKTHVFKRASGSQSKNVKLMQSRKSHISIPKAQSRSFNWYYWLVDQIKPFWKSKYPNYRRKSHHRNKFLIQDFIPDLTGDYKVLVFNDKVFALSRKTRPNDFRASGSGRFTFSEDVPQQILDFSIETFHRFEVPFISLDLAIKDGVVYLIEFQFVHIGTYAAEKAPLYFIKNENKWEVIPETIVIEHEYAVSIDAFIRRVEKM
jgi:glutathione synthase/RimK-type ligase-like ATP-grasp enzyme